MKLPHKKMLVLVCLAFCEMDSYAAPTPQLQNSLQGLSNYYDAGRVVQQVQQSLPKPPKAPLKSSISKKITEENPNVAKIQFKFNKIVISGNTVFSAQTLQKIFQPKLGKMITLAELQAMVHAVTAKYRDSGYILSRAILPPQTIREGVVQVQIVEGFVSDVTVTGDPGRARRLLEGYGKHIQASKPLNIDKLERYALLANDLPGFNIQSVLTPSKTTPAGADLNLLAKRKIGSAFFSYDNYGTRYIGPQEVSFGGSLYSLFAPGDSNTVRFSVTSRPHELRYVDVSHAQPIGTDGLHWQLGSNYAETRPDFILAPIQIVGHNTLIYTDFSYPIIRDRSKNFTVHSGFNYQNVNSTILGTPFYQDRIRSLVVGATFDSIDSWRGITSMGLDVVHGFDIMGAHDHQNQSRSLGRSIYTRINPSISRLQALTSRFSLYGALRGQYTRTVLLATEQYGVGGPDIGRGYDPSEIVGDNGVSGKLELRVDTAPDWKLLNAVQYYAFYDAGVIWNIDYVSLPAKQSLTSLGIGARFTFIPQVTGNLFLAKPLTQPVAVLAALNDNIHMARIFFQVTATL